MPAGAPPPPRVLFVDDDPSILAGFSRNLRRHFQVVTAPGGAEGVAVIESATAPFEVVVSDMRMPGMDGAAFLKAVRRASPDSVRVLLTGQSDASAAAAAVNDGQIARFLFKPVEAPELAQVLDECVRIHRLRRAEQELLDKTLRASVRALVDVLALTDPETFARVTRIRDIVTQLIGAVHPQEAWVVDVAAMLSQLGSAALPRPLVQKINRGEVLSEAEAASAAAVPNHSLRLIEQIPRLDAVRSVIGGYGSHDHRAAAHDAPVVAAGCAMLRLAVDLDAAERRGVPRDRALTTMAERGIYDPRLLAALEVAVARDHRTERIALGALRPGMVIAEDLVSRAGSLLVSAGYVANTTLVERLRERAARGELDPVVTVRAMGPAPALGTRGAAA